jgi:hypothetical protein
LRYFEVFASFNKGGSVEEADKLKREVLNSKTAKKFKKIYNLIQPIRK